jgi:antirestriction protein
MNEHHDDNRTERERTNRLQPRIWIGSLADYNAGRLHGDWVDAAVEDDELLAAAQRILATSQEPGAEEWGIFDFDEFGAFQVGEYEDLMRVARIARGIAQHGPAFAAWAQLHDGEPDMLDSFEDAFLGHYDAAVDWAYEVLDDHTLEADLDRAVPDSLRAYITIDYAAFVHDSQLGGDIDIEPDPSGGVWVYRCNP